MYIFIIVFNYITPELEVYMVQKKFKKAFYY